MSDAIEKSEAWAAFLEMRAAKGKRAPFTPLARQRILFELRRFAADGQDPEEILWTSVTNGWSGVFALRRIGWQPAAPTATVTNRAVERTQQYIAAHSGQQDRSEDIARRLREARAKIVGAKG